MNICNVEGLQLFPRPPDDKRIVYNECPTKLKAVILHKTYVITPLISMKYMANNICIECTFMCDGGDPDPKYTKALFKVGAICQRIVKSANSLIASQIS